MSKYRQYSNFERGAGGFISRTIEVDELIEPGAYTFINDKDRYGYQHESSPFFWDGCVKSPFVSFGDLMDYLDIERKRIERQDKLNKLL